jgi:hypothetical protein
MIDAEIRKLPPRGKKRKRYRQYESAKRRLCPMFPGCAEYEYICKAIAKRYGI